MARQVQNAAMEATTATSDNFGNGLLDKIPMIRVLSNKKAGTP